MARVRGQYVAGISEQLIQRAQTWGYGSESVSSPDTVVLTTNNHLPTSQVHNSANLPGQRLSQLAFTSYSFHWDTGHARLGATGGLELASNLVKDLEQTVVSMSVLL